MLLYKHFKLVSDPNWLHSGSAECLSLTPYSPFLLRGALGGTEAAPLFLQMLEQRDHLSPFRQVTAGSAKWRLAV